jgi:ubiquitin C-terminal hydrolase
MPDSESSCLKLIDCLKEEFSSSVLSKGNEWNCPSCLEKRRAYQTTVLFKTGKYLLINIKRFKQNYQKNRI